MARGEHAPDRRALSFPLEFGKTFGETRILLNFALMAFAALGQGGLSHYWHKITDKTFTGVYNANAFDLAMMIPYFIVLFVLAFYGLHRYALIYDYFVYRKNIPKAPPAVENWPKVTIQLPIFNERYVIERLVDAVAQFDYPRELLDVQVLDDSTD